MTKVCIHNGTDEQKTLSALKKAASHASGKARGVIQGLAKALSHNPAARGRKTKGVASMAKKRTKRATAKRRTAPNPTPRTRKRTFRSYKRRSNPSGFAAKVKGLDITGILMEGAGVAAGSLASSFASRQAARMLPDMNPTLRTGLSTILVTGGLAYFGGGKGFLRNMAVGSAANGLTSIASSLAPGLFGGVDDLGGVYTGMGGWNPDGTWNEELGTYADESDMGGVYIDQADEAPTIRNF